MLRFSKKFDYGIVALSYISQSNEPISAKRIADHFFFPNHLVANILKIMKTNGLLDSKRGINGGYFLIKNPQDISIRNVIELLDGPISMLDCSSTDGQCKAENFCPSKSMLHLLFLQFRDMLDDISLKQIITEQKQQFSHFHFNLKQ